MEKVKDLFIFCCFTGLAYKEMAILKKEDIVKEFEDNFWLQITRFSNLKELRSNNSLIPNIYIVC